MGRLSGIRYRDLIKRLKRFGFQFDRQAAGSHELWYNPETDRYTTIPNHPSDMPEGTVRAILKQAGVERTNFLNEKTSENRAPSPIILIKRCLLSQIVIPEAILIGNPACNKLKSWIPDKGIRA